MTHQKDTGLKLTWKLKKQEVRHESGEEICTANLPFFDSTYDWQVMMENEERFLPEAKEKVLSWRVNLGEGEKKKEETEKKQLTLISSEDPFQ